MCAAYVGYSSTSRQGKARQGRQVGVQPNYLGAGQARQLVARSRLHTQHRLQHLGKVVYVFMLYTWTSRGPTARSEVSYPAG